MMILCMAHDFVSDVTMCMLRNEILNVTCKITFALFHVESERIS